MVIFTYTRHVLLNKPCTTLYSSKPTEVIEVDILATHRAGHYRNQLFEVTKVNNGCSCLAGLSLRFQVAG